MDIKTEIETKIKQIDRSIRDLRIEIDGIYQWKNLFENKQGY